MGVNLSPIVEAREIELSELRGKTVAIDAYNTIFQFLSIIRQPDGKPLQDSQGRVTSHLSGILYRGHTRKLTREHVADRADRCSHDVLAFHT